MTNFDDGKIEIKVPLVLDQNGYFGRECPQDNCKKYFKVMPGTGIQGVDQCICPYCGYKGSNQEFFTQDQKKRLDTAAQNLARDVIFREFKKMEFDYEPQGRSGFGMRFHVEKGAPIPLHVYSEKDLETYVTCANCSLKYAIYGFFAYCPDCGEPNPLQIFHENLKVIHKAIEWAKSVDPILAQYLIENSFEDCVSSFDGFGRELCHLHSAKSKFPDRVRKISFQNLESAKENFKMHFDIDLDHGLSREEWNIANMSFLKRHLLAHKLGIVDEDYIRRSGDTNATTGRKVRISYEDTLALIPIIEKLAGNMVESLGALQPSS